MQMQTAIRSALPLLLYCFWIFSAAAQDFQFDGSMSRQVLENYLSRSTSYTELLHDDLTKPRNSRGVDPRDNLRFILDTRAKLVGRALMVWGRERNLSAFLETAKPFAAALHKADPEIILQAAAFEIVTRGVETLAVPERVLREFGQSVTNRNFRYQDMLYAAIASQYEVVRNGQIMSNIERDKIRGYAAAYRGPNRTLVDKYLETMK